MNKNQKIILAIFVPIIIFFIALTIADNVGVTSGLTLPTSKGSAKDQIEALRTEGWNYYYDRNPFNWKKTWYVWLIALAFCGIFEYKLFADKKRKTKRI